MKLSIIIYCMFVSDCYGFNILDVIITKETMTKFKEPPRLRKDFLCWRSDYNLGTILKTFLATSSRPIGNYKIYLVMNFARIVDLKNILIRNILIILEKTNQTMF